MKALFTVKNPPANAAYWQAEFYDKSQKLVAAVPILTLVIPGAVDIPSSPVTVWSNIMASDMKTHVGGGTVPGVVILEGAMYDLNGTTGAVTQVYPPPASPTVPGAEPPPPPVYDPVPKGTVFQYPSWLAPVAKFLPTLPWIGPPLPSVLHVTWPWYKEV